MIDFVIWNSIWFIFKRRKEFSTKIIYKFTEDRHKIESMVTKAEKKKRLDQQ